MAASSFIVITPNERLSVLVDGIEKCRPLNSSVETHMSKGTIEKTGEGYVYNYQINSDDTSDEKRDLKDMLLNQFSAFRKAYDVRGMLHIFVLENPETEEDLEVSRILMEGVEDLVTDKSKTKEERDIYVYRILIPYVYDKPCDVAKKLPGEIFEEYQETFNIDSLEDILSMIVLDNRDLDGKTVSRTKEDHYFKLPRLLCDFMMLASSSDSSYGIFNSVNKEDNYCSLGYAESMYYFDDVKQYIEHADMLHLYQHILNDPDQTETLEDDQDALDYEKYPLGLIKRAERLEKYDDVPFTEDINKHQDTADYVIDECLKPLRETFKWKIQQDIDKRTEEITKQINKLPDDEEREQRMAVLEKELEKYKKSLPEFFTRSAIGPCVNEAEETETRDNYHKLIEYVTSRDFFMFVDEQYGDANEESSTPSTAQPINTTTTSTTKNSGCLAKFFPSFNKNNPPENVTQPVEKIKTPSDYLKDIKQQLLLKSLYKNLLAKINEIKAQIEKEQDWCDKFELTNHSHHYFHLIDLQKLKDFHKKGFDERYNTFKDKAKSMKQLHELRHEETEKYVKQFEYIDWNEPFVFVKDVNDSRKVSDDKFVEVINNLTRESTPFIHYDEITAQAQNNITIQLYSDIPKIDERFDGNKNNIKNATLILPYKSTHIASKICVFQLLPLPKDILNSLFVEKEKNNVTLVDTLSPLL